ncbi:MAG: hypothetical protein VB861_06635, partial [Planctomycetaceae bacterium]
ENEKQQAALKAARAVSTKVKTDLDVTNKLISTLQAKGKTLAANMKTYQEQVKTYTAEQAAAAKTVAALAPVVPLLKETSDKAQATAAKATGDKELAGLAATLKVAFDKRNGTLVTAKKTDAEKTKALAKSKADLVAAQKDDQVTKAGLVVAQKRGAELTKAVKPAADQVVAVQKTAATASSNFNVATLSVVRWKDEIAYTTVLDEFDAKEAVFNTAADALAQANGEFGLLQKDLDQKNANATTADAAYKAAVANVAKSTETVSKAQKAHADANNRVAALTKAIPLLKESGDKVVAAAKVSGDKELAALAVSLKGVHDKKVKELEATKKDVVVRKAAIDTAQAVLVTMQKAATASQVALTAANKRVADQVLAMKTPQAKVDQAKTANDAARAQLDAVQKRVNVFKAKTTTASPKTAQAG